MEKTERLGLILTRAEKHALVQLAEVEGGLSQAALIRRLIRSEAKKHGYWPLEVVVAPATSAGALDPGGREIALPGKRRSRKPGPGKEEQLYG